MGDQQSASPKTMIKLLEKTPVLKPQTASLFDRLKINYNADGTVDTIESKKKTFSFVWTFDKKLAEVRVTLKSLNRGDIT